MFKKELFGLLKAEDRNSCFFFGANNSIYFPMVNRTNGVIGLEINGDSVFTAI